MPLLVGGVVIPVPPPTPPPPPVITPPPDQFDSCVLRPGLTSLTDPGGFIWILTDGSMGIWEKPGRRGFHAPTYQFYDDESPAIAGSQVRGVRAQTGSLFIPLVFNGGTDVGLRTLRRAFIKATSPTRGMCTLTVAFPDSDHRHIDVYRDQGMEGEEGPGSWGIRTARYGLTLRAPDPYWYGDDVVVTWAGVASQTFFPLVHSPTNFVNLLPSQVLGSTTITTDSDVEAYPRWTINGPATTVTLTHSTLGKTLVLNSTLGGSTNKRIIDTRPGVVSIVDEAGTNRWTELASGSTLWNVQPGRNDVTVSVSSSTSATGVELRYRPRYEGY